MSYPNGNNSGNPMYGSSVPTPNNGQGGSLYQNMYQQVYGGHPSPSPHNPMYGGASIPPPAPNGGMYNGMNAQPGMTSGYGFVPPTHVQPAPLPNMQPQGMMDPYGNPVPVSLDANEYFKGFHDGTLRTSSLQVGSVASWVGPLVANLILFVGPVWYIRRRMMSRASSMPSNPSEFMEMLNPMKSRNFRVDVKGTTFKDVIGVDEAKEEVKQYVDFLKNPAKYTKLGGRLPKGCLLTGRPGTGKTLLAKAVAGEADVPFFSCSGADFIEVFGGSGPKRVRELFKAAREASPCVVFIDEIDAIGSRGGGRGGMGGSSSEENRTINQLLSELDGMNAAHNIIVLAATNFPDAIDKALLREGRFDRKVTIPMPDLSARKSLFDFYLKRVVTGDPSCTPVRRVRKAEEATEDAKKKDTADATTTDKQDSKSTTTVPIEKPHVVPGVNNIELAIQLSDRTPGVSPAQIATIVNEAALTAAMSDLMHVPLSYLQDAIDDVLIGKKRRQRMSELALKRTAYHEVGHCIAAWMNPLQKDVIKLSIIPRGRAGGYTQQIQNEAMDPQTNVLMFSQLCVLVGGRIAEQIIFGDVSTGAMDDLQRATKLAMDQLLLYGMSPSLGFLSFKHDSSRSQGRGWMPFSENLHARAEKEAKEMVERAFKSTEALLHKHKDKLIKLSELLLEKKELDRAMVMEVLGPRPKADETSSNVSAEKLLS